jgi:adenylosuccinate synthase
MRARPGRAAADFAALARHHALPQTAGRIVRRSQRRRRHRHHPARHRPDFADKVSYNGIRWSDFADKDVLNERLKMQITLKNKVISALGGEPLDFKAVRDEYLGYYALIKPYIKELFPIVQGGLRSGQKFLLEQAMGSCLDTDWGTYPFVTGSTTIASAATTGLGVPPRAITEIIGVTKAYTTRVGAGPMPTEVLDDEFVMQTLSEVAATTGRIRRGGWLDTEVVRFAAMVSGVDALFLTKLDILSAFEEIKICTGYELDGKEVHYYDLDSYQLGPRQAGLRNRQRLA